MPSNPVTRWFTLRRGPGRVARAHPGEDNRMVSAGVIEVRQAAPPDAVEIGEAHASAWEVAYVDLFEPDVLRQAAAVRRTMWAHMLGSPDFDRAGLLVVEQAGRVVGFSHFGPSGEERTHGEIFGFYAHPDNWGSGVAVRLMDASLARLNRSGLVPVVVWTHPGALRAQAFYAKSGFRATGRARTATLGSGFETQEVEFVREDAAHGAAGN